MYRHIRHLWPFSSKDGLSAMKLFNSSLWLSFSGMILAHLVNTCDWQKWGSGDQRNCPKLRDVIYGRPLTQQSEKTKGGGDKLVRMDCFDATVQKQNKKFKSFFLPSNPNFCNRQFFFRIPCSSNEKEAKECGKKMKFLKWIFSFQNILTECGINMMNKLFHITFVWSSLKNYTFIRNYLLDSFKNIFTIIQ